MKTKQNGLPIKCEKGSYYRIYSAKKGWRKVKTLASARRHARGSPSSQVFLVLPPYRGRDISICVTTQVIDS